MRINVITLRSLQKSLQAVPRTLKDQSEGVLKVWAHQCECVLAQRLRRGQQMFSLYTKLWEEHALKEFLNKMRKHVTKCGKELLASAVGLTCYSWESNRITNKDMGKYLNELDYIHILAEKTMTCEHCLNNGQTIACKCPNQSASKIKYDKWVRFFEKEDMVVWRKECDDSGNYEYKVYGSFDDVSGEDFLNVQIDTEYRKRWDNTAVVLEVVEKDPTPLSNSDVIYWELLWPKLFVNRDYVFNRRFMIDKDSKTIVLVSRGTEHPACPIKPDKYRVDTYWSYMVIKPFTELDKPGVEFSLTYFDDPGVNVPSTVTTWVAMRAMPDYLTRLRVATREYNNYCAQHSTDYICKLSEYQEYKRTEVPVPDPSLLMSVNKQEMKTQSAFVTSIENAIRSCVIHTKGLHMTDDSNNNTATRNADTKPNVNSPAAEILISPSASSQAESPTSTTESWKYLHKNYYFT
ncbi:hypothetical protein PPYR_06440 [Photinus pyralis]|nr:hypothetical protein PPYR_06440 [Photinus pyralis]